MQFVPASPASVVAFVVILLLVVAAFLLAAHRAAEDRGVFPLRAALAAAAWLGLWAVLVGAGILSMLPLRGLPFFFGGIAVVSFGAGLSSFGKRCAISVPLTLLVAFQAFRLPLELVLHNWAASGTIPSTMTWSGQNWDILAGLAALLAAPFANRRAVAWAFNVLGGVLLLNVMRVAVLSSPVPFGWGQQPALQLAWHLPYAFIGPVCVGGALFGHVVLTRALLSRQN